jgi:hypothetical protein
MKPAVKDCQLLSFTAAQEATAIRCVTDICHTKLGIPAHLCEYELVDQHQLEEVMASLKSPHELPHRRSLLVAGNYLEEQITVGALHALMYGFDVFVLRDVTPAKRAEHIQIFDSRLVQAGAVLTTLGQLAYDWLSSEPTSSDRDAILKLQAIGSLL